MAGARPSYRERRICITHSSFKCWDSLTTRLVRMCSLLQIQVKCTWTSSATLKLLVSSLCPKFSFFTNKLSIYRPNICIVFLTGFVTAKVACCGQGPYNGIGLCTPLSNLCPNRDLYAFWDPFHPSERANKFIVEQIFSGSNQYMNPMNLSTAIELDSKLTWFVLFCFVLDLICIERLMRF